MKKLIKKTAIIVLIIMTVVALILIFKGVYILYDTEKMIDDGLKDTQRILQDTNKKQDTDTQNEQEQTVGEAIMSVFSPKEHQYALYDGLTNYHLQLGVARASESADIGKTGNCVIYGHRDSSFRCLKNIKIGNKVIIRTKHYEYIYLVQKTLVCSPQSAFINKDYDSPYLTLVTCYPFVYSGPAQERYLVICKLDSCSKV
ncbi:MAG: class D sortase [Oscillospiraceae bacterium]